MAKEEKTLLEAKADLDFATQQLWQKLLPRLQRPLVWLANLLAGKR